RPNLVFDIQADDIPLYDGAFGIAHRRRARLHPAVLAVEAPQPVSASIWLAGGKRTGILLFDARHVVGMNAGIERAGEPGFSGSVQFFKVVSEEFTKLLAAINRLAIRRGAIDHRRQRFDELPKEAFSLAQRLLGDHMIM